MKYFEDFARGETEVKDGWPLTEQEIVGFARQWDPQPQHLDPEAAKGSSFAGLIAAGVHLLALSVRQLVTGSHPIAVIAAMGWEEVLRFVDTILVRRRPARP